jgi:hypothetical protein
LAEDVSRLPDELQTPQLNGKIPDCLPCESPIQKTFNNVKTGVEEMKITKKADEPFTGELCCEFALHYRLVFL